MQFSTKTVKGTMDILPEDMLLRNFVRDTIANTYVSRGYTQIETPCLENLELLTNSDGGENLRLLFKILKRGDKLTFDDLSEDALCDLGLRFDLTLPLSRFYANNRNDLPMPFKAFQMGYVWRAEKPQKGRLRQFIQCDVDIIGDESIYAEIDLMLTVPKALYALGFRNFTMKVNDRRILKQLILQSEFEEKDFNTICISLDKIDKIGKEGVMEEILSKGYEKDKINRLLNELDTGLENLDNAYTNDLKRLIQVVSKYYPIEFDPTLVRGMGYYTGPIFEIVSDEFKGSIAGGGRYDNLSSKFQKDTISAVGFSIGFERIITILKERGFEIPNKNKKIALIFLEDEWIDKTITFSDQLIKEGNIVSIYKFKPNKIGKKINSLKNNGYDVIQIIDDKTTGEDFIFMEEQ